MGQFTLESVVARSLRAHALVEPADSIDAAIVAAAGIYGSSATSHLGLAMRLAHYAPADLERERLERRSVLGVPGMRGSVFLAPLELAPAMLALSRPETVTQTLAGAGMDGPALARLRGRVGAVLAGRSLSARAIRAELGEAAPAGPLLTLVLREMAHRGRIVAAKPVGTERAGSFEYVHMADWAALDPVPEVDEALAVMAPVWMRANGPGSSGDLAWWAGVTKAQARRALEAMGARPVEVASLAGEQWATDEILDELATAPAASSGRVRFLPAWDAWLMARRERSRLLREGDRPYVVDRSGNTTNTIALDGRIVGTWDVDGQTLLVHPFEPLDRAGLETGAAALRVLYDWTGLREVEARPLHEQGQNGFRSPLRGRDGHMP